MRLANQAGFEAPARGVPALQHFAQLLWRRARGLRRARADLRAVHVHESHFLVHSGLKLALALHFAAARAASPPAAAAPRSARPRAADPARASSYGPHARPALRAAGLLPGRSPAASPVVRAPSRTATGVTPGLRPRASRRAWVEQLAERLPRARAVLRDFGVLPRLEHRRAQRDAAIGRRAKAEPGFSSHLTSPPVRGAHPGERSTPRILVHHRYAVEGATRAGRLAAPPRQPAAPARATRPVAPVPIYYASARAGELPSAPVAAATSAPTPPPAAREPRARATVPYAGPPAALDRAMTDKLADEVMRRIERRVRIERERRGI
jgi:hypothetical protein